MSTAIIENEDLNYEIVFNPENNSAQINVFNEENQKELFSFKTYVNYRLEIDEQAIGMSPSGYISYRDIPLGFFVEEIYGGDIPIVSEILNLEYAGHFIDIEDM